MVRFSRLSLALACIAAATAPLAAQSPAATVDSAAFVTRLGTDTLVIERFVRSGNRVEAEVLMRTPRTSRTRYVMQLTPQGGIASLEATGVDPVSHTAAAGRHEMTVRAGDSLRTEVHAQGQARSRVAAAPPGTLPFIDMVHWPFEIALMRARAASAEEVVQPLLTGARTSDFRIGRVGADSMTITHPFRGTMRVHVDADGRLLGLDAGETTRKLIVERTGWLELDATARAWAAADAAGRSAGALSGRAENAATVHGANITIDLGTPMKRGRQIWGGLVPYGELWRTGANRATHFTTDRDLLLGSGADTLALPAGTYTLFSIPEEEGGVLIVSAQTGQNGNSYDPSRDFGRVPMTARPLPQEVEVFDIVATEEGEGGLIRLQWDLTELVVPFRVR